MCHTTFGLYRGGDLDRMSAENEMFASLVKNGVSCCRDELLSRIYSLATESSLDSDSGSLRATVQRRLMRRASQLAKHDEFLQWLASRALSDAAELAADLLWYTNTEREDNMKECGAV
jgi:hypothetical protein